jgi:RNA methyltransferase, TrmH family
MEVMHENKYPVVSHPRDPRLLTLRSLQLPQGRSRTGRYIIEGIRHLARAVEHNAPIESVFLEPSVLSNPFGQKLARRRHNRGIPGIRLSHELYRDLTLAGEPQGIGAVIRQQWTPLSNLKLEPSLWLTVESIESSGNLGTIIRTAEAAGASKIFVLGPDCDPTRPRDSSSDHGPAVFAEAREVFATRIHFLGKVKWCCHCCLVANRIDGLQSSALPISCGARNWKRQARALRPTA